MGVENSRKMLTLEVLRFHFLLDPDHNTSSLHKEDWLIKMRRGKPNEVRLDWPKLTYLSKQANGNFGLVPAAQPTTATAAEPKKSHPTPTTKTAE